jgi:hypothetical protein
MALGQPAKLSSLTERDQVIQLGLVFTTLCFTARHRTKERMLGKSLSLVSPIYEFLEDYNGFCANT